MSIPLEVQIFITKEEEQALIPERNTVDWRRENRIPDSDDIQTWLTRKRSDTGSTTHSDSHISKKNRLGEIAE
jgi:hypothetical protein